MVDKFAFSSGDKILNLNFVVVTVLYRYLDYVILTLKILPLTMNIVLGPLSATISIGCFKRYFPEFIKE